jgi:NTP pyrophosphatase (non-canonical NTP hydrolase)
MNGYDFNAIAEEIHKGNVERGFWDEPRNKGELLMLIVAELAEALEADRDRKYANIDEFVFHQEQRDFNGAFKEHIKDSFEDEIADTMIRLFDLAGGLGIDLNFHIPAKVQFNKTRGAKHGKAY